jgi:DNA polymerase III epsilon subunit-like protein
VAVTRIVVRDTETTGLVPGHDRVVWVAVAVLSDGTVTERWSALLDPGPGKRARIACIDLAGQPTFADIAPRARASSSRAPASISPGETPAA